LGGRGLERCQPVSKAVPQTHLSTIDCWVRVQLRPDHPDPMANQDSSNSTTETTSYPTVNLVMALIKVS